MSRRTVVFVLTVASLMTACVSATAPNTTARDCGGGATVGSGDKKC